MRHPFHPGIGNNKSGKHHQPVTSPPTQVLPRTHAASGSELYAALLDTCRTSNPFARERAHEYLRGGVEGNELESFVPVLGRVAHLTRHLPQARQGFSLEPLERSPQRTSCGAHRIRHTSHPARLQGRLYNKARVTRSKGRVEDMRAPENQGDVL